MTPSRPPILWLFLSASIVQVGLSLIIFSYLPSRSLYVEPTVAAENSGQVEPREPAWGLPIKLIIPKIGVRAEIGHAGILDNGEMEVTEGPESAGWFHLGPRPGEWGAAVIAGHSGWRDNIPAVFDDLDLLEPGDQILIESDRGQTLVFVMRESGRYEPNADAEEVFISRDNQSHLNLVTCRGVWNKETKSYSKRLVIFADLVEVLSYS